MQDNNRFGISLIATVEIKYYLVQRYQKIVKNRSPITHVRATRSLPCGEQVRGLACYTAKISSTEEDRLNSRPWRSDFYISNNGLERVALCILHLFAYQVHLFGDCTLCKPLWSKQCKAGRYWCTDAS